MAQVLDSLRVLVVLAALQRDGRRPALSLPEAWSDEGAHPLGGGEWLLRYRRRRTPPTGGVHG